MSLETRATTSCILVIEVKVIPDIWVWGVMEEAAAREKSEIWHSAWLRIGPWFFASFQNTKVSPQKNNLFIP